MKEWKVRQQLYHKLHVPRDILGVDVTFDVVPMTDAQLIESIREYFTSGTCKIVHPAKSYAVAIIYARLIERYFGGDHLTHLDDPELLFGNDKFFVPYSTSQDVYDAVLSLIPTDPEKIDIPQVRDTVTYFKKEFLLVD